MEKTFATLLFGLLIILLISNSVFAQNNIEDRIRLIEASQNLQRQMDAEKSYKGHNSLGIFFTNYRSSGDEVNPGLRLGMDMPITGLSILFETLYYRAESSGDAFISFKFLPLEYQLLAPYVGAGGGITGHAKYQIFLGADIYENYFIEAKYINEDDSELVAALGFQLKF